MSDRPLMTRRTPRRRRPYPTTPSRSRTVRRSRLSISKHRRRRPTSSDRCRALSEPDTQPVDRQPAAATPEEEQAVETAEAGNAAEDTLVPSPIQDTDDWVDRPPIDTGQAPESPALLNPEEALAELAAKGRRTVR